MLLRRVRGHAEGVDVPQREAGERRTEAEGLLGGFPAPARGIEEEDVAQAEEVAPVNRLPVLVPHLESREGVAPPHRTSFPDLPAMIPDRSISIIIAGCVIP